MTTHVIMNVDRPNGSGGTYKAGVEYDLPDDLAALWRGQGVCRLTSVRSEQTGAVISATGGNFPDAPAQNKKLPVEYVLNLDGIGVKAPIGNQGLRFCHTRGSVNSTQTGTAGADLLLASIKIPGGAIGKNGRIFCDALLLAGANNANVKTLRFKLGGVLIGENTSALTSTRSARFDFAAYGNGSDETGLLAITTSNATIAVAASGAGSGAVPGVITIDHSVDQLFEVYTNLAVGSDSVTLKYWDVGTAWGA